MAERGVTDWRTDVDHTDPGWVADPYPIWEDLREECPIAHSGRYGGVWLPTRHEDVSAIANDTEHFTSRSIIVTNHRPPMELAPQGVAPPISSDPPYHAEARRMLLPAFSLALHGIAVVGRHMRGAVIDVMNACAAAGIKNVSFQPSGE